MKQNLAWMRYDATNSYRDENGWLQNCWVLDRDETAKNWAEVTVVNGVVRWTSCTKVPPADCLNSFEAIGMKFDRKATDRAAKWDLDMFLEEYRAADHTPDAEQMFEMRAAFGEGTEVVDVITGKRTKL